jgi:hypothetical protein
MTEKQRLLTLSDLLGGHNRFSLTFCSFCSVVGGWK